jgi:hypothetical protein
MRETISDSEAGKAYTAAADYKRGFWKLHRPGPVWPGHFPQTTFRPQSYDGQDEKSGMAFIWPTLRGVSFPGMWRVHRLDQINALKTGESG